MRRTLTALLALLWLCSCGADPGQIVYEDGDLRGFTEYELRGERFYNRYCVGCHGVNGDGQGPAAIHLNPKPRNFLGGMFKFRSTPTGSLPTDDDLMRTLRQGVHGTSMPPWGHHPEAELKAVIAYLKTFSPAWKQETPEPAIGLPGAPLDLGDPERVARGHEVYKRMQCGLCHGEGGEGDGPSANDLKDNWGQKVLPFDFTRKSAKGGDRPEDLYRTFMTGVPPMPDYSESIPDMRDRWDLVAFVLSLRKNQGATP